MLSNFPSGIYKSGLAILCKNEKYDYNEVIKVILNHQNRLLDVTNDAILVQDSLKEYLALEEKEKISIDCYKYLSLLAQSILISILDQPLTHCCDILKSYTNLFFEPFPTRENSRILLGNIPPLQMFDDMKKNFIKILTKETMQGIESNEIGDACKYIFEICLYVVRIYLIIGNQKKADEIIKGTKVIIKYHGQHLLNAKLKIAQAAILYEYQGYNDSQGNGDKQGNNEKLEKIMRKVSLYIDHHKAFALDYLAESYLLLGLIKIRNPAFILLSTEIDEYISQAENIFLQIKHDKGLARIYLVKTYWLF